MKRTSVQIQFPVDVAVSTVPRRPCYIHRLIRSLGVVGNLTLVAGAPESRYLDRYKLKERVAVFAPTKGDYSPIRNRRVHYRATWNYWRTLTLAAQDKKSAGLLTFEDDVILARAWQNHFKAAVVELESKFDGEYALSLYAAYPFKDRPDYARFTVPFPKSWFFGSQAIYYPQKVKQMFCDYLWKHGVERDMMPYDLLLKEFLLERKIPLAVTFPCLAQHIGRVSTGLGDFHDAPGFQPSLLFSRKRKSHC